MGDGAGDGEGPAQQGRRALGIALLQQAPDALLLVTDGMEIEAVIQAMVDAFRSKVPEEAWPGSGPETGQPSPAPA
jgi:hypothetical protein